MKSGNNIKASKKNITTVDEYLATLPATVKPFLKKLRQLVVANAPAAEEVISYGMPAYKLHGMLLYYSAFKNHYSLFAMPNAINAFRKKLSGYELSKGTIRFSYNKPLPTRLIAEIIKYRVNENRIKQRLKKDLKKPK